MKLFGGGSAAKDAAPAAASASILAGLSSIFGSAGKRKSSSAAADLDDAMDGDGMDCKDCEECEFDVSRGAAPPPPILVPMPQAPPAPCTPLPAPHLPKGVGGAGGGVMEVCLLQKADGSWELGERLAAVLGASVAMVVAAAREVLRAVAPEMATTAAACGTLAGLAALHWRFAGQRQVWELQADKALRLLASLSPAGSFSPAQLSAAVAALQAALSVSQAA